jgi:hypothetical protein
LSDERPSRAIRYAKQVGLSALLGLGTSYAVFHSLYPTATFPAESSPSAVTIGLILLIPPMLAGWVSNDVTAVVAQAFLAIPFGILFSTLLVLSPSAAGLVFLVPEAPVAFVVHYGLLLFVLSPLVAVVAGPLGLVLQQQIIARGAGGRPPPWARERK